MSEISKIKIKALEDKIAKLLETIKEDIEPVKTIKIYENLITAIKADIEKNEHSTKICNSCGDILKDWEKGICGPCKIKDGRYPEEIKD